MHFRTQLNSLLLASGLGLPGLALLGYSAPLPQDAYIWQRQWTPAVQRAVSEHGGEFRQLVLLAGEVSWNEGRPTLTEVPIPYSKLRGTGTVVGLALRIGVYSGPFSDTGEPIETLTRYARALVTAAATNQVHPVELQLDFDCPESKLGGYTQWVSAFKRRLAPLPIIITALPSWLTRSEFSRLAMESGSYVLQVHSLERPKGLATPFSLCNPAAARRAVERASQLGVGFRVALPTYGYCIAFDSSGQFIGLAAEGPSPAWPAHVRTREAKADPAQISELVRSWNAAPPPAFQGLIWYRLPTEQDRLNWPWRTLAAVRQGRPPVSQLRAEAHRVESGLYDIDLVNDGELDQSSVGLRVEWNPKSETQVVAADAMAGFDLVREKSSRILFSVAPLSDGMRVAPGSRQTAGWVRLERDEEVRIEMVH